MHRLELDIHFLLPLLVVGVHLLLAVEAPGLPVAGRSQGDCLPPIHLHRPPHTHLPHMSSSEQAV